MTVPADDGFVNDFERHGTRLRERDISFLPIAPGTKRPGEYSKAGGWRGMSDWTRFGKKHATDEEFAEWCTWPDAGIGILTGALSGLVGIDRDYDAEGTDALEALIPPTIVKKKGKNGYTAFFQFNGERSCSFDIGGKRVLDVLAEGRQTVVPPSMHPSGCAYVWTTFDTLEDITGSSDLPKLPDDFLQQVERELAPYQTEVDKKYAKKAIAPLENTDKVETTLSPQAEYFRDLQQAALAQLDTWIPKLIPRATKHGDTWFSYATWRGAENPNVKSNPKGIRDWGGGYGMTPIDLIMYSTGKKFAQAADALQELIVLNEPEPIILNKKSPAAVIPTLPWLKVAAPKPAAPPILIQTENSIEPEAAVPDFIRNPPGILGDIARWITATAPKEQPELSVAAAIALGSVVMGRSYVSQYSNFTSLYVVMIGKSTEGKEHPQSCVEKVLVAAGMAELLAGSGYTSAGGVHTALLKSPCHLVIIDEIGKMLKISRSKGNSNGEAAIDKLVESFGRLDGVMRPPTYSKMTQGSGTISSSADFVVHNPAISLLGATTPNTFFGNLTDDLVQDGFLGRCIIVESKRPRQLTKFVEKTPPPAKIVEWCKAVFFKNVVKGNLAGFNPSDMPPITLPLPFSPECEPLLRDVERAMNEAKDKAEEVALDMLLGRTIEKSMRLAMIVAKARDAAATQVEISDLKWSLEYIQHYDLAMVHAAGDKRTSNEYDADTKKVLEIIGKAQKYSADKKYTTALKAGYMPKGKLQKLMKRPPRKLAEIIDGLIDDGSIEVAEIDVKNRLDSPCDLYFLKP